MQVVGSTFLDATGALLCGVFALQEDAQSYLFCLQQILREPVDERSQRCFNHCLTGNFFSACGGSRHTKQPRVFVVIKDKKDSMVNTFG